MGYLFHATNKSSHQKRCTLTSKKDNKPDLKELHQDLSILKSYAICRLKHVLIFSILNHPCSFMVFYYLFGVFLS